MALPSVFSLSVIFMIVCSSSNVWSQYPSFPMLPWLATPQRYSSGSPLGPLVMPNPPIFAQTASADQDLAFSNYRWNMFYRHDTTTVAAAETTTAANLTTGAGAGSGTGAGTGGTGTNTGGSSGAAGNSANGGVNANSGGLGQNGGGGTGDLGAQGSVAGSLGGNNGNGRVGGDEDLSSDETTTATAEATTNSTVATTPALNFSAVKNPDVRGRGGQACKSPQVPASGSQTGVCIAESSAATNCTQGILVVATQCRFFQKCCVTVTNDRSP